MSRFPPPPQLAVLSKRMLVAGVVGAVVSGIGMAQDSTQFARSYLIAWLFWLGVGLGTFAIGMLHHVSGGAWGIVVRRVFDAAGRTLPLSALLFVPIALHLPKLYLWAQPEKVHGDHLLEHKAAYLNPGFFLARTAFYFAIWIGLSWLIDRASRRQDESPDPQAPRRLQTLGSVGLVLYALTITFAAIDWLMSLDPHWYSSIYGVYLIGAQGLAGFAFVVAIALLLARWEPLSKVLAPRHTHDLGKLMFAFVMLWAYFSYSQFLLTWSANLPEEISWYLERIHGNWKFLALALVTLHFALPFLLLLFVDIKRHAARLAAVATLLLAMRYVDLYWQASPAFPGEAHGPSWQDAATLVAIGGLWLFEFFRQLGRRPILPLGDPRLEEAIGNV